MADPRLVQQGEERREAILEYLKDYIAEHGFAPTGREIASSVGIAGPTVLPHLRALQEAGLIKVAPGVARGIVITPKGRRKR